ncbi:MAG: ABC transporter permease [Armatimonadota bacterium]|nr:ABC transporter permease [Armatimonadota bacterium]
MMPPTQPLIPPAPGTEEAQAAEAEDRISVPPAVLPEPPTTVEPVAAPVAGRGGLDWIDFIGKLGPVIGLIFVLGLFSVLRPSTFFTFDNVQLILLQTAVVVTAALGMTMIIISGGIDLSVGSNIALCTVVIALLLAKGLPPVVAAAGGMLTGALCGLLISFLITRLHLSPFIVTLGMWGALRGAAKGLAKEQMVQAPSTWLNGLLNTLSEEQRWMLVPPGVWMMLVLAIFVSALLRYTRFGRHIFAIGSNEQTARLCGVAVEPTKLLIYTVAAAFAGLAGVLQFSYLTVGDPTTAAGYELDIIAAVVIGGASLAGGQGSIFGTLVGAMIMTSVSNGCTKMDFPNWVQEIVTGGIIVFAVALDRFRHRTG